MKTLKTLLSFFAMAAVFSAGALAQSTTTNNADVAVTADVVASLTVSNESDVAFGNIPLNSGDSYIKANTNDGTADVNLGSTASAGQVSVEGASGTNNVVVTFGTATLTDVTDGSNSLTFTPTVYFGSDQITSGDQISLTGGTDNLDIGGTLDAPTVVDDYSTGNTNGSPLTITVEYN